MADVILDRTINQFLEHGRFVRNWSPKTIRCYSQCLAVYRKANSELPTKTILTAFVVQMRQQGRSAGGCNVIIRSLNSFISWLLDDGDLTDCDRARVWATAAPVIRKQTRAVLEEGWRHLQLSALDPSTPVQ